MLEIKKWPHMNRVTKIDVSINCFIAKLSSIILNLNCFYCQHLLRGTRDCSLCERRTESLKY